MGINKAILIGNVGKDPEIRHLENGTAVCNFSMATNEVYYTKDGEKKEVTEWHRIVLWRRLAEVAAEYVKKGSKLYIEGKIQTRSFTTKEGETKYITDIQGDKMELLDRKGGSGGSSSLDDAYSKEALSQVAPPPNSDTKRNKDEGNPGTQAKDQEFPENEEGDDLPF